MIIKSIELADYRNYDSLNLQFDKGTNILYGDNAQGKTNILEAIYVAATTKSHRGSKEWRQQGGRKHLCDNERSSYALRPLVGGQVQYNP